MFRGMQQHLLHVTVVIFFLMHHHSKVWGRDDSFDMSVCSKIQ